MYGITRLLTISSWGQFQQMFEESGFEVYEHWGLVEVNVSKTTEAERAAENRRLTINELMERPRDVYWRIEGKGNVEQTNMFISNVRVCLEPVLNQSV